jgi:hypothetical protein
LRTAPRVLLGIAEAWVAWDLIGLSDRRWAVALSLPFLANLILLAGTAHFHTRGPRWIGLSLLGATYVTVHGLVLGVALLPAILFVTLLIASLEIRILVDRFAPLFVPTISAAQRRRLWITLARAAGRLAISLAFAILVPLFAADLAGTGVFPVTSVPTALLLAVGLVAVVLMIALLPTLSRTNS